MVFHRFPCSTAALALAAALSGCVETTSQQPVTQPAPTGPVIATETPDPASLDPNNPIEESPGAFANVIRPDFPLLGGYRNVNDPCQYAGDGRTTRRFLSESTDLVACLRGGGAERELNAVAGVRAVAQTADYTLFSVPKGAVSTVPPLTVQAAG